MRRGWVLGWIKRREEIVYVFICLFLIVDWLGYFIIVLNFVVIRYMYILVMADIGYVLYMGVSYIGFCKFYF